MTTSEAVLYWIGLFVVALLAFIGIRYLAISAVDAIEKSKQPVYSNVVNGNALTPSNPVVGQQTLEAPTIKFGRVKNTTNRFTLS